MKLTCSKTYTDLPFAHRQPNHDGHCAWIHGHNWSFDFEFHAETLDRCGFVVDFGKLKFLKQWLEDRFDHTLVLNLDDPYAKLIAGQLKDATCEGHGPVDLIKLRLVPDCSCEGLAAFLLEEVDLLVRDNTAGRVGVCRVTVIEDSKNSATACKA